MQIIHSIVRPRPRSAQFLSQLAAMMRLARQRHALGTLDADQLADIGLTAKEAETEAARPFWDVPCHWRG